MTVPVNLTGITHSIENLMSTRKDLPAFLWEEDSALLIQLQLNQGHIPTPIDPAIQATWVPINANDRTWTTVNDLSNKYSYVWIPVSLADGDYDLYWDGAVWSRQYKAQWYNLPNNQTSFEISKAWYFCNRCSLRNIPALFMDMYHYFFHNRNQLYYAYTVPANAPTYQNHKLRVTVNSNGMPALPIESISRCLPNPPPACAATDSKTLAFSNSAGSYYYSATTRSRVAVGQYVVVAPISFHVTATEFRLTCRPFLRADWNRTLRRLGLTTTAPSIPCCRSATAGDMKGASCRTIC